MSIIVMSGCARTTIFEPTATADEEKLQREFSSYVVPGGAASRSFDVTAPGPPLCCTVRPGTERNAAAIVNCWRASIRAPGMTVTLSGVRDSG